MYYLTAQLSSGTKRKEYKGTLNGLKSALRFCCSSLNKEGVYGVVTIHGHGFNESFSNKISPPVIEDLMHEYV
tara:strand:- start:826 stop:1044 length:219 start_codon:yes stop_codon:yes gene_type:complete